MAKNFLDVPINKKTPKKTHEANIEMSKNNIYGTGNFLDNEYFPKHYKLIAID